MPDPHSKPTFLVLSLLVGLGGCASNPVEGRERTEGEALQRLQASAITDPGQLSLHSRQVIRMLDLEEVWAQSPETALASLKATAPGTASAFELQLAAAEASYCIAGRTADPRQAQLRFLDALSTAGLGLSAVAGLGSVFDPRQQLLCELFNRGTARFLALGQDLDGHPKEWPARWDGSFGPRLAIATGGDVFDPARFDRLLPAQEFAQEGIAVEHRRFGVGATMIGIKDNRQGAGRKEPLYPADITAPVTVVPRLSEAGTIELAFFDPHRQDRFVSRDGREVPLAADFTAPLAWLVAHSPAYTRENPSLFNPESFAPLTGLYLAQHYDPTKIPVVFVHGLWSSPLTWIWLINEVWGDPELRDRYQIWFYAYPTGLPIFANVRTFRQALLDIRSRLDPEGGDRASREIILVGHSMGGLLSKSMVKSTGDRLWNARSTIPFDQFKASDEDRALLKEVFFLEPLPFVKRVVFMAVPHRGSSLADGIVGAIGSALITVPKSLEDLLVRVTRANPGLLRRGKGLTDGVQTSIAGLSADSPLLQELDAAPFPPGLPVHSIIGDEEAAGHTGGSDGVVPYSSSVLAGAVSELVVKSGHSLTGNPSAMAEVRRILHQHLADTQR